MEYNRYNRDNQFRRDYRDNPYDRGPPNRGRDFDERRGPRGPSVQRPHYSNSNNNFRRDGDWQESGRSRPQGNLQGNWQRSENSTFQGNWHRSDNNSRFQGNWQRSERVFDDKGRQVFDNRERQSASNYRRDQQEPAVAPQLTPLEEKARSFLQTVLGQEGVRSKLIFLETVQNSLQTLQGTVDYCQMQMVVEQDKNGDFVMKIGGDEVAKGPFPSKQCAKSGLAEQAMDMFKKDCFYIIKKKEYEEISTKMKELKDESQPQSNFEGSKAHQMMLKMGWGGKGLGVNEQGSEKTVAETIDQNISRQGLGTDDVFKKIHKLLEDFSKSDKITLLKFDPDFTSEERAHIHKIANKFGLKSKSEGKGEKRRITVTKKLHRADLVYNLLTCGLENDLYKLIIPSKFEYLWQEEEDDNEDDSHQPHFSS